MYFYTEILLKIKPNTLIKFLIQILKDSNIYREKIINFFLKKSIYRIYYKMNINFDFWNIVYKDQRVALKEIFDSLCKHLEQKHKMKRII